MTTETKDLALLGSAAPDLVRDVATLIDEARQRAAQHVNAELTELYWRVGKRLAIEVLGGERAAYGKQIIASLSGELTSRYGRGWTAKQLHHCVRFAEIFPAEEIVSTLCRQLSWSHLRRLIYVEDSTKREFYLTMAKTERWSVRQLAERMDSQLFERTAISRKPDETIRRELAQLQEQGTMSEELVLKESLHSRLPNLNDSYLEKDLEDAILRELQQFLLEMGSGFSFVARQYRIQIDNDDYYIDLLFYNRKLRRLVVIDLKVGSFKPEYKGQMELYLRWLAKNEQEPGEEPPLGIILCAGKKQEQIELLELDAAGIHVAEYLTTLPPREVLQQRLHEAVHNARARLSARQEVETQ